MRYADGLEEMLELYSMWLNRQIITHKTKGIFNCLGWRGDAEAGRNANNFQFRTAQGRQQRNPSI